MSLREGMAAERIRGGSGGRSEGVTVMAMNNPGLEGRGSESQRHAARGSSRAHTPASFHSEK
jgi:hypothetical protein